MYSLLINIGMVVVIVYCLVSDGSYLETDRAFGSAVLNVEGAGSAPDPGENVARMVRGYSTSQCSFVNMHTL